MDGKRTADEAGLADAGQYRPAKSFRIEDFLESMDPSVRIKLRSMFDDGLLQASDLDERNIAELRKFDAAVALEILENYSHADFSTVRNRRAYLAGAIKRKMHLAAQPKLHPDVQQKLNLLKQAGTIRDKDLDGRCLTALSNLPAGKALTVLDVFASKDFNEVRNPAALFMATVKQIGGADAGRDHGGRERGPRAGGRREYGGESSNRTYPGYPGSDDRGFYDQPPPPRQPPAAAVPAAGPPSGGLAALGGPGGLAALAGILGVGPGGILTGVQQPNTVQLQPNVQLPPGVQTITLPAGVQPGAVLGGVQQQYVVSAGGVLTPVPAGATVIGAPGAAGAAGYQLQVPGGVAPAAAPAAAAAPPPPGVPPEWAAGHKQYGIEQAQLGVRVQEFHGLSPFALYVHPSPALKLQQLWDDGNELVSMLDDKVWQVLAELPAPEALAVIDDAGQALSNPHTQIRNINAYFMSVVRKVMPSFGGAGGHDHGGGEGARGPGRAGFGGGRGGYSDRYDSRDDYHAGGGGGYRGGRGGGGGQRGRGRGRGPPGSFRSEGGYGRDDRDDGEGGGYKHTTRAPAIHLLPPDQRAKAEELCREHAPLLREEHFDEGVIDTLKRLPPADGMKVLNELGQNSMAGVRNLPAYIMGICKRYSRGDREGGPGRGGGRGGGGDRYH